MNKPLAWRMTENAGENWFVDTGVYRSCCNLEMAIYHEAYHGFDPRELIAYILLQPNKFNAELLDVYKPPLAYLPLLDEIMRLARAQYDTNNNYNLNVLFRDATVQVDFSKIRRGARRKYLIYDRADRMPVESASYFQVKQEESVLKQETKTNNSGSGIIESTTDIATVHFGLVDCTGIGMGNNMFENQDDNDITMICTTPPTSDTNQIKENEQKDENDGKNDDNDDSTQNESKAEEKSETYVQQDDDYLHMGPAPKKEEPVYDSEDDDTIDLNKIDYTERLFDKYVFDENGKVSGRKHRPRNYWESTELAKLLSIIYIYIYIFFFFLCVCVCVYTVFFV